MKEFPSGTVLIWESAAIPDGWQVLASAIGRFIMGASVDGDIGDTGGADTHSHVNTGLYTDYGGAHIHDTGSSGDAQYASANVSVLNGSGATATKGHTHNGSITFSNENSHRHIIKESGVTDNNPANIRRVLIEKL